MQGPSLSQYKTLGIRPNGVTKMGAAHPKRGKFRGGTFPKNYVFFILEIINLFTNFSFVEIKFFLRFELG